MLRLRGQMRVAAISPRMIAQWLFASLLVVAHAASVAAFQPTQVTVTSGFTLHAPRQGNASLPIKTNGLHVSVAKRDWPGDPGYHQCDVTVSAVVPRSSERVITVRLELTDSWFRWNRDHGDIAVTGVVVIPPGEASASSTMLLPEHRAWQNVKLDVWDDGEALKDMTDQTYLSSYGRTTQGDPAILAIGASHNFPDTSIDGWKRAFNAGLLDLPTDWLAYTSVDVAIIDRKLLGDLIAKHPARWKAMRAWIATGGNLWIYGVQDSDVRRGELAELLDLVPKSDGESESPNVPWQAVQNVSSGAMWIRLGGGVVVALEMKTPRNATVAWKWITDAAGTGRTDWSSRNGVTFDGANPDFWTLTIPGVGLPPIGTFQILITLFVIAIGPVNYAMLRRRNRLNMMIVTVPLSALAISATLIVYALVADGLSTRMRTRSFTMIDQRRGEASCWARLSYYAGRSHSAGLTFDSNTAVYPMEPDNTGLSQQPTREVVWTDEQRLPRGWLPARTASQLVTVRHRTSGARIDVTEAVGQPSPQAVNRLGCRIERLWLVDNGGQWFRAQAPTMVNRRRSSASIGRAFLHNGKRFTRPPRCATPATGKAAG